MSAQRRPGGVYCPGCRELTTVDERTGRCLFCDELVLGGRPLIVEPPTHPCGPGRGARFITAGVLRAAYDLYLTGLSLRRVAEMVLDQTTYRNAKSCANSIHDQWRVNGWPLRDRGAASRAASWRHSLARDREHRLNLRRQRGEIRGIRCAAVKTRYGKGRGERCQRPALDGGRYCRYHEPALRDELLAHLERMRGRRLNHRMEDNP
jgi:hypothetical protein